MFVLYPRTAYCVKSHKNVTFCNHNNKYESYTEQKKSQQYIKIRSMLQNQNINYKKVNRGVTKKIQDFMYISVNELKIYGFMNTIQ